ncbi:RteC domain-containing protein [Aequorivita viscosa]|uniref:RteC protein n=1 Tax=Aequorivita viscosa TaxID=797419 RepID=A0A1M6KFJ9_9FLAO|nr:RteC domain-containing protein [Aequorivita viscosa]SDX20459.1 RteC protein [Aequorivita viscosa]SHJ57765.1 RteC protein [Aequorivita viscosa]
MNFYSEVLSQLEIQLQQLDNQSSNVYSKAEKGIALCSDSLEMIRKRVLKNGFKDIEEECQFFKTVKPKIVGFLIHFVNTVAIERAKLMTNNITKQNFYVEQIAVFKKYFVEQREFYEYYIRGLSHRDSSFFTRNSNITSYCCTSITSIIDPNFSSSKDMVLAKILGNTLTINYLKKKLSPKKRKSLDNNITTSNLKWTGTKTDLVELVYALHSSGLVNNGQAGINEVAKNIEGIFSTKIENIYRSFLEIRTRKRKPTKLLDTLKKSLINKIIQADD